MREIREDKEKAERYYRKGKRKRMNSRKIEKKLLKFRRNGRIKKKTEN